MEEEKDSAAIELLADRIFQFLSIVSVPFLLCFYWPNHDVRAVKLEALQFYAIVLVVLSVLIPRKRPISNVWPVAFLLLAIANIFMHGLGGNTVLSLPFILFPMLAIYVLHQNLDFKTVMLIKEVIVYTALFNCALFLLEYNHIEMVFTIGQHGRPSGFMCYPINFAILCSVAIFMTWSWQKWLVIPLGLCLCLTQEYSCILGLILAISMPYVHRISKPIWVALFVLLGYLAFTHLGIINGKLGLRTTFWGPIFNNVWARPLDGWGLGAYTAYANQIFKFSIGNWTELHCEPLDLLFSMGLVGVGVVCAWGHSLRRNFTWNIYTKSILVMLVTSCFHSILHFGDTLWLSVILYTCWQIEKRTMFVFPDRL